MKTNEKKIWRKLYMKLSEIEGFKGGPHFFSFVKTNEKKNPYKVSPERKHETEENFFFPFVKFSEKSFGRRSKFFSELFLFLLFFSVWNRVKRMVLAGEPNFSRIFFFFCESKWKFWGNVTFHWWKIKFWPENWKIWFSGSNFCVRQK